LDAFDECSEDGRRALVDFLCSLQSPENRFRFFIATRPNSNIDSLASAFADEARSIEVTSGNGEQTRDLKHFVDNKLLHEYLTAPEKCFISEGNIEKTQGLYVFRTLIELIRFLMAGLHLKSVVSTRQQDSQNETESCGITPTRVTYCLRDRDDTNQEEYGGL
jgi:hypothetical protein